jgi:chromosome segregation ATPase
MALPHNHAEQSEWSGVYLIMRYILMIFLTLAPDQVADSLLAEIRALRLDLWDTAAAIQRVQIVMYRLQAQWAAVEKATGRLDMARGQCRAAEDGQKRTAAQIEQMKKMKGQSGVEQKNIEEALVNLQAAMEMSATQAQECQGEQADAESQFRVEQAKMSELESQLERLDQVLAAAGRK